jgi:hypothetical protein
MSLTSLVAEGRADDMATEMMAAVGRLMKRG